MANTKEIKTRIESVKDTRKITNAMYLIASTKLRKARNDLDRTRPYFEALRTEIKRIFRTQNDVDSRYFYPPEGEPPLEGTYACLVITADKGLAGAYNQNVIKEAMHMLDEHPDTKLYVVGEYGRHFFTQHHLPMEHSVLYTAQNPTMQRAREICDILLEGYDIMQSYVSGFIYSALIDSFCSEQNARMTAMDSANSNAEKLLAELSLQYNRVRQAAITQEITEVSAGAKAQRQKHRKEA